MTDWLLNGIFGWLAERVQGALSWLMDFLTSAFFSSPDMTGLPQVQALAERSRLIVNAVFVLAVVAAGILIMAADSFQVRYELKDLLPRLVFAFTASNFGTLLCQGLITTANALTRAMVGQSDSGPRVIRFVAARLAHSSIDPLTRPLLTIIALIIVVLFFQVVASWFARIATLLVLAGIAPLALACYALPQTQAVAGLWWRALLGALAVPLLQGVAFSAGVDLLLAPDHNLMISAGLPIGSDVINLFLIACLLMVTVRIPRLVARYAAQGGQRSTVGLVVRAVLLQSVSRRIPGLRRAVR